MTTTAPRTPDARRLLRTPFRHLVVANAASLVAERINLVVAPLIVLERSSSARLVALVLSALWLPRAVMLLAGGVLADRLPRRRVLGLTYGVRAVLLGATAILVLGGRMPLPAVAVILFCDAVLDAAAKPAVVGMLPDLLRREDQRAGNALIQLPDMVGWIIAAPLAGLLTSSRGFGTAYALAACCLAGARLALRGLAPVERAAIVREPEVEHEHPWRALRTGIREITGRPPLAVLLGAQVLYGLLVVPAIFALGPVVVSRSDGDSAWALATAALGFGSALGVVVAPRVRALRPGVTILLLALPACTTPMVLASGAPLALLLVAMGLCGACMFLAAVLWDSWLQQTVAPAAMSRAAAVSYAAQAFPVPIGLALIGPAVAIAGPHAVMVTCAALAFAATALAATTRAIRHASDQSIGTRSLV